jgi:hypothetical protein
MAVLRGVHGASAMRQVETALIDRDNRELIGTSKAAPSATRGEVKFRSTCAGKAATSVFRSETATGARFTRAKERQEQAAYATYPYIQYTPVFKFR